MSASKKGKKKEKRVKLYHGTSMSNLTSILNKGILKSKWEGGVYLTDSKESAVAWVMIRIPDDILVIEVEVDESKIVEGCDHSPLMQKIFGVGESLVYMDNIPSSQLLNFHKYPRTYERSE